MHYIGLTVFRSVARYSPKLSLEIELVASGVEHLSAALGCENQHLHKMTEWIAILDSGLPQCGDLSIAQHAVARFAPLWAPRSEEHTSELQPLMRLSYAVFCWNKKT